MGNCFFELMNNGLPFKGGPYPVPYTAMSYDGKSAYALFSWEQLLYFIDFAKSKYHENYVKLQGDHTIVNETVSFSPDGRYLAFSDEDGSIYLADIPLTELKVIHSELRKSLHSSKTRIRFSSSSRYVMYISNKSLYIYSIEKSTVIASNSSYIIGSDTKTDFWPDDAGILLMNVSGLYSLDLPSFSPRWMVQNNDGAPYLASWRYSHDAKHIVFWNYESPAILIEAESGIVRMHYVKGNSENVTSACFSEDDTKVIVSSYDSSVRVWSTLVPPSANLSKKSSFFRKVNRQPVAYSPLLQTLSGHIHHCVTSVIQYDRFTRAISFTAWDSTFYLWDLVNGRLLDKKTFSYPIDDYRVMYTHEYGYELRIIGKDDDSNFNEMLRLNSREDPFVHIVSLSC